MEKETDADEIIIPCSICKQPIDIDEDDQVENGVCGDCLDKFTRETGKIYG
jgi:hypothetical protein